MSICVFQKVNSITSISSLYKLKYLNIWTDTQGSHLVMMIQTLEKSMCLCQHFQEFLNISTLEGVFQKSSDLK